jgi:hypothetical protein
MKIWVVTYSILFALPTLSFADSFNCTLLHNSGGTFRGFSLQDSVLYIGSSSMVKQYDISDPYNPALLRSVDTDFQINSLVGNSDLVFASHRDAGITILDFRNEEIVVQGPMFYEDNWRNYNCLQYQEPYLYFAKKYVMMGVTLEIADMSNIDSPQTWSLGAGLFYFNFDVCDTLAFIGHDNYPSFSIFNIANPANIQPLHHTDEIEDYGITSISAKDSLVYLCGLTETVSILDISTPSQPVVVNTIQVEEYFDWTENPLVFSESIALQAAGNHGIRVYDVSDPVAPYVSDYFNQEGFVEELEIMGSLVCVSIIDQGIKLLDVGSPTNPDFLHEITSIESPGNVRNVDIENNILCVVTNDIVSVVKLYEISNPHSPTLLSTTAIGGSLYSNVPISLSGSNLFVYNERMRIFDVSDPTYPAQAGTYFPDRSIKHIAPFDDHVVLVLNANQEDNVSIIDVSDPQNPVVISTIPGMSDANDVAVDNNIAFIVNDGSV